MPGRDKILEKPYEISEHGMLPPLNIQELAAGSERLGIEGSVEENLYAFSNLMMMYDCAIREVKTKLEVLDREFSVRYKRNPISSIKSRVKKPVSIYKKLKKYGLEISEENILNGIHDIAGIRVICSFIDDIYMVAALLTQQDDIIPVFFSRGKTPMKVEIQIRTIAMDFWASLEHQLRYKKDIETVEGHEEISRRLLECADTISETDRQMQEIKRMIGEFNDLS